MAISSISSNDPTNPSQPPENFQKIRQDFQQLSSALASNNLSDAQAAYASLESDAPGLFKSQNPGTQQLAAVGQALQSGDLSGAQQAFSALQQAAETHRHHRHHHAAGSQASGSSTDPSAPSDPLAPNVGSQINVSA